jgi:phospholipid/cholesterol/gamma-HCH transport system substrate-binding protein
MSPRTPLLVGFVLILAVAGLTMFMMGTSKDTFSDDATFIVYADFSDASGIRTKTRVQINGIDVGKIFSIEHVRGKNGRLTARIGMRILNKYDIYENADIKKAAESLLGDFRLDLDPGMPPARKLGDGEIIPNVHTLSDLDEIKSQLLQVSKNVNEVTQSLAKVIASPEGEGSLKTILHKVESSMDAIEATTRALEHTIVGNDKVFAQIIQDVGHISASIATVAEPGGDFRATAHNLALLTAKLDKIADSVHGLVGGQEVAPGDVAPRDSANLRATLDNLNESVTHLNAITRKIDEGQGTVGRAINDPGIADRVEETLDSANQIIGSIAGLETQIELRSDFDVPLHGTNTQIQPSIKNVLRLNIMPKPDKYYILEAVSDPRGNQRRNLITTLVNNQTTVTTDETNTSFNDLKFSAEFAKRYYNVTLRFGIIENTGGLGMDLFAMHDKAQLRIDAFDFSRRDPTSLYTIFPRLRATAMYEVVNHVSVQAGIDDPFNESLATWFLGGVLAFTDDDLKALLAIGPKP